MVSIKGVNSLVHTILPIVEGSIIKSPGDDNGNVPAGAVAVRLVEAAAITAGTTQDFVSPGMGTPKAAMFLMTKAVGLSQVPAAHALWSMGVTDGVNSRTSGFQDIDNRVGTQSQNRSSADATVIHEIDPIDGSLLASANFSSWITDGVQIQWTDLPVSAYRVVCVLFGGSDLQAHVNNFTTSNVLNGEVIITDPGFEPDQVIFLSTRNGIDGISDPQAFFSLGLCDNGVSVVQGSPLNMSSKDNAGTSEIEAMSRIDRVIQNYSISSASVFGDAEIDNFTSVGFSSFTRRTAENHLSYLALSFGGSAQHWVGNFDSPTAVGDAVTSGIGFSPQFIMYGMGYTTADDTSQVLGEGGSVGIGIITPTASFSACVAMMDQRATSATRSILTPDAVRVLHHDVLAPLVGHRASLVSMDADGWTLNYSEANSTPRKWTALAIE